MVTSLRRGPRARRGSPWQFIHPSRSKRDLPIGTLPGIERQAGVALRTRTMTSYLALLRKEPDSD